MRLGGGVAYQHHQLISHNRIAQHNNPVRIIVERAYNVDITSLLLVDIHTYGIAINCCGDLLLQLINWSSINYWVL